MNPSSELNPLKNEYTIYLYYTSYLLGLSSLVSYYYNDYLTFFCMFAVFLTSINYWKNPRYGIARNIDLFLVRFIAAYFYVSTFIYCDEYNHTVYNGCLYNTLFLFFMEHIYVYFNNKQWVVIHMTLHMYLSFLTPFVLYIL